MRHFYLSLLVFAVFSTAAFAQTPPDQKRGRLSSLCELALKIFKGKLSPEEPEAKPAEVTTVELPTAESTPSEPVAVAIIPMPEAALDPSSMDQPVIVELTSLSRRQAEEQSVTLAEITAVIDRPTGEPRPKAGNSLEVTGHLRGRKVGSVDLGVRRKIEYRQDLTGVLTVRSLTNPIHLYTRAKLDMEELNINYLSLEKLLSGAKDRPTYLDQEGYWELDVQGTNRIPLKVRYGLRLGEAYIYRIAEVARAAPPPKVSRFSTPPLEVNGVLLTPQAERYLQTHPLEIDHALNEISPENLRATPTNGVFEFTFTDSSSRSYSIGFVDDDVYGIVVMHIVERTPERPLTPNVSWPFEVTSVTERTLAYWGMTVDDLAALFRNRKETPRPIGENPFGFDPMREMFNSSTARPIGKANGGRTFQVITSSTVNGAKPIILSIRRLEEKLEEKSVASEATPVRRSSEPKTPAQTQVPRPIKTQPLPYAELVEAGNRLLQAEEIGSEGVLRLAKPELYATLMGLQQTSREFDDNAKLLAESEDFRELVEEENETIKGKLSQSVNEIARLVFAHNRNAISEAVIEVKGDDRTPWSNEFALNLKNAFVLYAREQGWSVQTMSSSENIISLRGRGVLHFMRLEEGLQRLVGRSQDIGRGAGSARTHTARAVITVVEGPLPAESRVGTNLRRTFEERRNSRSSQFVRSYHIPSNRVSDERVEGLHTSPPDLLEQGDFSGLHRRIEYSLLIMEIKRLLGD